MSATLVRYGPDADIRLAALDNFVSGGKHRGQDCEPERCQTPAGMLLVVKARAPVTPLLAGGIRMQPGHHC